MFGDLQRIAYICSHKNYFVTRITFCLVFLATKWNNLIENIFNQIISLNMKKITCLICLSAFALAPTVTLAQESGTSEGNVLQLTGAYGSSDAEYVLQVELNNKDAVRDFFFEVTLPEGLSVTKMEMADLGNKSYNLVNNLETNNAKPRAVLYSTEASTLDPQFNSAIVNITLGKDEGATFEDKTIRLNDVQISASDGGSTYLVQTNATATHTIAVRGDVYAGTAEVQKKTREEFQSLLETAPNAIMIVDAAYADKFQGVKNVVVNDNGTYTCDDFELTDGQAFYSSVDFTATSATYSRGESSYVWGTIMLPFEVESDEAVTYYTLSSFDTENVVFSSVDEVEANTPAVFKMSSNQYSVNAQNVEVKNTENDRYPATTSLGWTMCGTYQPVTGLVSENGTNIYFVAQDKFWKADVAITVSPFRGWFETTNALSSKLRICIEGETEGIQTIEEDTKDNDITFDLLGRRSDISQKGLRIQKDKIIFQK